MSSNPLIRSIITAEDDKVITSSEAGTLLKLASQHQGERDVARVIRQFIDMKDLILNTPAAFRKSPLSLR